MTTVSEVCVLIIGTKTSRRNPSSSFNKRAKLTTFSSSSFYLVRASFLPKGGFRSLNYILALGSFCFWILLGKQQRGQLPV